MTRLLLVRHCETSGQEPDAPLTEKGKSQSKQLCSFLEKFFKIGRIFSSPYLRAQESIKEVSDILGTPITIEEDLRERDLLGHVDNQLTWPEIKKILDHAMQDYGVRHGDGESSQEALDRALAVIERIKSHSSDDGKFDLVVSHGNIITLLLKFFNPTEIDPVSFHLSNPDVFLLTFDDEKCRVDRLWTDCGPFIPKERPSARAILLNPQADAVFLFELQDNQMASSTKLSHSLWITPGGGVDEGEDLEGALKRELYEELALQPEDYHIYPHLWTSLKPMVWKGLPHYFIDNYFLVQLKSSASTFDFSNHTEEERAVLKRSRWWTLDELAQSQEKIVPPQIKGIRDVVKSLPNIPSHSFIEEGI